MNQGFVAIVLLCCGFVSAPLQGQFTLRINELMAQNTSGIQNEEGNFTDWFELHNYGDTPLLINGLHLSDNPFDPFLFQIPQVPPLSIAPGAFLIFLADGSPETGHVPFQLDHQGEFLGLYSPEGIPIHEVNFGSQAANISYGLLPETLTWNYFSEPSPGSPNSGTFLLGILEKPVANHSSACLAGSDSLLVSISHNDDYADLRYTLNQQEVGPLSDLYTSPMWLQAPAILRVRAYRTGYADSEELIVQLIPADTSGSAYTLSIAADPEDVFGPGGIYTFFLSGLEKPSHVAVFGSGNELLLESGSGLKIHAPEFRQQQAFRLIARSEYGNAQFSAALFPDRPYQQFQHLILRSGGNDAPEFGKSGLRDPLISSLFAGLNPAYGNSAYRPARVYLNGEFWGMYNLRERQDEHWTRNFFGVDSGFTLLERTLDEPGSYHSFAGTWDEYNEMVDLAANLDMSDSASFALVSQQLDLMNFCDYQLTEIFVCNRDWLSNNVKMWKPAGADARWHWIIWDTDWGLGTFQPFSDHGFPTWNALLFAMSDNGGWLEGVVETELLQNLTLNEDFRWLFCSRAADLCNSHFRPERITSRLDSLAAEVSAYIPLQCDRWGSDVAIWQSDLGTIEDFVHARPNHFLNQFSAMFGLGVRHELTLRTESPNAGYIAVNTIYAQGEEWTGEYFENLPVKLQAFANPGYVFTHWSDGETSPSREIELSESADLTAFYDPLWAGPDPVINEIMPCLPGECSGGSWIELYNPSDSLLDLSGWQLFLSGEPGTTFGPNCSVLPNSFAVVAENPDAFFQQYGLSPLPCPLGFSLAESGVIYLSDNGSELADAIVYGISGEEWPERPQGYSWELRQPAYDNSEGANWFVRDEPGGSAAQPNIFKPTLTDIGEMSPSGQLAYPNPFTHWVALPCPEGIVSLEVFGSDGKKAEGINREIHGKTLRLTGWENEPPGLYLCRMVYSGGSSNIRLVKQE